MLSLPSLLLPRPPNPGRRPRRHPRRQTQEAPVRSPASWGSVHGHFSLTTQSQRHPLYRPVKPTSSADCFFIAQHKDALLGGEPQQGRDQVRRV